VPPPVSHLNPPEPTDAPPPPQRRAPRIPTAPVTNHELGITNSEKTGDQRPPTADRRPPTPTNDYQPTPHPADGITQQPLWEALQAMEDEADNGNGEDDDLLPEAIALVRSLNKASTSLLQRRFRIGYTRAARLMDALEDAGIIGPPTGTSKAREVFGAGGAAAADQPAASNDESLSDDDDSQEA
jgi:S-DNA-T family DNA segregation ATPase FtsK/SpoIIIE